MTFFSLEFLAFAAVAVLLFRLVNGRAKVCVLAVANCAFYACWDWRLLFLLAGMALACHVCACRRATTPGVILCLATLGVFKYCDFFLGSFVALLRAFGLSCSVGTLGWLLPLGISFYVFRGVSYLVDVGRGQIKAVDGFIPFFAYFGFFPQLLAGPIVRAGDFLPQLENRSGRPFADDLSAGLAMFAWGAVMKVALADSVAPLVDGRFAAWSLHSSPDMLIASAFYSFQIYGDFCGYSLMSLGVARVMGFRFADNFNAPYFSSSFQEFWRRWHISLSTWLRDYLYIPLGGSRTGHTDRNLLVTMLLGGLWHGANWTFVAWGGLHGLMLCLERKVLDRLSEAWPVRFVRMLLVFAAVTLLWIFFRAETFAQAAGIIGRIFTVSGYRPGTVTGVFQIMRGLALIGLVLAGDLLILRGTLYLRCERSVVWTALFCAFCAAVVLALGTFGGNTFIYQQF